MKPEFALCWTARIWSVASSLLLLAFVFGGREHLRFTTAEAIAFLFFPIGVIAGFFIAWRRELAGGLVTVGSLALFYLLMFARSNRWPAGPYFLLFATPGFLYVVDALFSARRGETR